MQMERAHVLFLFFFSGDWLGTFFISFMLIILKFLLPLLAMSKELQTVNSSELFPRKSFPILNLSLAVPWLNKEKFFHLSCTSFSLSEELIICEYFGDLVSHLRRNQSLWGKETTRIMDKKRKSKACRNYKFRIKIPPSLKLHIKSACGII